MSDFGLGAAALDGPSADGPLLALLRLLAASTDGEVIGSAIAEGLLAGFGPTQLSAYFLNLDGDCLEERVRFDALGRPSDFPQVPLDVPIPMTDVVRTGEAGAWTMAEAAAQYPPIAGWVREQPVRAQEDVVILPVRARGRVVGALLVSFPGPVERSWRLRAVLESAATALAVWSVDGPGSVSGPPHRRRPRSVALSARQESIVDGVRRGLANGAIAAELGVSVGTVKADLAQLYQRFAVSDRASLLSVLPAAAQPSGKRRRS